MLYQLRVDAVKLYYENQGEKLDDSMACARELEYEQYLQSRIPWCKEVAWPGLCRYWTSKGYKTNRGRGREARLKSEDIAQNRGGSRPFAEAQQYLEETLGPKKATTLNTYTAMKCGMKNVSSSGNNGAIISNGAIMSQKAQKRFDDYTALAKEKYPDSWEGRKLDGELLYEASGGIPHGRVSIGDGAVKKADIKSTARKRNTSSSISLTLREKEQLRRVNEENAELRRAKELLQQKVDMHGQLITALFKEIGKELPAHIQHILSHGAVSQPEGTNNSSQAGSQAVDGNNDVMESSEENDTTGNVDDQTVEAANHGGN